MSTGVITWLVKDRGFGFIRYGEGQDLFFHRSQLQDIGFDLLSEGQSVQFRIGLNHRGLQAIDIKLLREETGQVAEKKPATGFFPRTRVLAWYQSQPHQKTQAAVR